MTYGIDKYANYANYEGWVEDEVGLDRDAWKSYRPNGDCTCGKILQDGSHNSNRVCEATYTIPIPPIVKMSGKSSSNFILPTTHHDPTFWFAVILLMAILMGVWYGKPKTTFHRTTFVL